MFHESFSWSNHIIKLCLKAYFTRCFSFKRYMTLTCTLIAPFFCCLSDPPFTPNFLTIAYGLYELYALISMHFVITTLYAVAFGVKPVLMRE